MSNELETLIKNTLLNYTIDDENIDKIAKEISSAIQNNPEVALESILSVKTLSPLDNFNKMLVNTALTKADFKTKRMYLYRLINDEPKNN